MRHWDWGLIGIVASAAALIGALVLGAWFSLRARPGHFTIVTPLRVIEATAIRPEKESLYFETASGERGKVYGNFTVSETTALETK